MVVERVEKLLKQRRILACIKLEITNACNLKCIHCYVADRDKFCKYKYLEYKDICHVLEQAQMMGTTNVVLTGGEPLLHPEIEKIVKKIKSMNFILTIFTNGTLISAENIAFLKSCDLIEVTRYGCSKETYESTTCVKDSYKKYLSAVKILQNNGVRFIERAMLLRTNERDIEKFKKICQNRIGTYVFSKDNDNYAAKARASDRALIEYYKTSYSHNDFKRYKHNEIICNFAQANLCIKCNGDIVPCINWPEAIGNIHVQTIQEIWEGTQIKKLRLINKFKTFQKCLNCENNIFLTHLCLSDNMYERNDYATVSDEKCRLCNLKKRAMLEKEG